MAIKSKPCRTTPYVLVASILAIGYVSVYATETKEGGVKVGESSYNTENCEPANDSDDESKKEAGAEAIDLDECKPMQK